MGSSYVKYTLFPSLSPLNQFYKHYKKANKSCTLFLFMIGWREKQTIGRVFCKEKIREVHDNAPDKQRMANRLLWSSLLF